MKTPQTSIDSIFKWDGSDLGTITDNNIVAETINNKDKYWKVKMGEEETVCQIKITNTTAPFIIDELKPLFGIPKNGTHKAKYKNKMLLLIKTPVTIDGYIQDEFTLNNYPLIYSHSFILQVQEVFVFRELVGISKTYESSIRVRWNSKLKKPYPISYHEPKMTPYIEERVIPNTVLDKWFNKTDIGSVTRRLLNVTSDKDITEVIHLMRTKIENIINRLDKDSIIISSLIIDRITSRLLYNPMV